MNPTYSVVGSNGTCNSLPVNIVVQVDPVPNLSISGTTSICTGQSTTLTASGGTSYVWSGGISATTTSISVSPASTTTYYLTSTNSCGSDSDSATVVVNTFPVATITGNDSICLGVSTTLTASGGTTYQWSGGLSATTATITVSPVSTTTYTVVASNGACNSLPVSIIIQVDVLLNVSISGTTSICSGQSTTLTASGGTSYVWSGGTSATTNSILVSPSVTTTYYLTSTNACGSDSDTAIVVVNSIPVANVSGDDTICLGESTTLIASGGTTYQWSGGSSATSASIIVSPSSTIIYTVIASNGACNSMPVSISVIVNALPNVVISGQDSICQGTSTNLLASVTGGTSPYNYLWSNSSTLSNINVSPTTVSTPLGVFVTDQNGCSDSASIVVIMLPDPIALITGEISGCAPMTAFFTNYSTNATSYIWDFGNGNTSSLQNPSNVYPDSGSYNVTLIAINASGCSDTITINDYVHLFSSPVAGLSTESTISIDNQTTTIYNESQGGTNCVLYFGDGDSLVGCNWVSVIHNYLTEGVYIVTQIVTNSDGCSDTIQITVVVEFDLTLYIPNAFTPNSNDRNDLFLVYGFGLRDFKMMIFDRWGELIFETDDITKGWDGSYKGNIVQQGVYVWKVNYNTKRDGDQFRIGHVTVVR